MDFRHRDAFGRVSLVGWRDASREHHIDPKDGRLAELLVQGTIIGNKEEYGDGDNASSGNDGSNWTRIGPPERSTSPIIALVYWLYSSVLVEGSERRRRDWWSVIKMATKWVPTCLLLALIVSSADQG